MFSKLLVPERSISQQNYTYIDIHIFIFLLLMTYSSPEINKAAEAVDQPYVSNE
jgi:hypothetical protein